MKKENKGKIIFENEDDYKRLLKYERDKWFKYDRGKAIEEFNRTKKLIWEAKREETQRIADSIFEYLEAQVKHETMKDIMDIVFNRTKK